MELVKLPVAERLALIDELLASIPLAEVAGDASQVEKTWARWEELKANRALGISYDEFKDRLRSP